ncbi:MAG: MFS transporter [Candidatus Marinimicrobia bacterium]|nr:MFS transporter [Candidatus Neomarinimicrobiota bacterium]MCF7829325.1 MFS transporter [Candidatus Neomarinimicrobiota bacterium]MCF7880013.1 MFS transporter [Candidatus Neomarinimicrobiota bacterium]
MGFAMVVPFISIYFHLELGVSMTVVGSFFFITAIIRAGSQIIAGNLSDSIGRRGIMIFAQIVRGIVFFGVAVSIYFRMSFLATAFILITGYLLASFFQPVANAMIADIVPKEKRPEAYGLLRVAANIGWGIGPAAGGFLAKYSYASLFFVAGILAILSGITILLFIKESNLNRRKIQRSSFHPKTVFRVFTDRKFFLYCGISLMMFLTMAQLIATVSVYARESIGISNIQLGFIYSANAITVVLFQMLISRVIRHRDLFLVLSFGSILYSIGYSLMAIPGTMIGILVLVLIVTTAEMLVGPAASTMVARMAPDDRYGHYMGAFGLFQTLGWSIGPFIGGLFLDFAPNPVILWLGVSTFGLIGGIGYLWMHRKYPENRYN